MSFSKRPAMLLAGTAALVLGACDGPLDFDMRGGIGNGLDTAEAARTATANRPEPDSRGIISYPGYQVAIARRGDTLATLAARIGIDAAELGRFNGISPDDNLRRGEVVALPRRVAEPAGGPIQPGGVDIATIAGGAIDKADKNKVETSTLEPAPQTGAEPVRHKVARGETAYTIARLYNVSIRSLADWNGLGSDFGVREGQYLLIPVALPGEVGKPFDATEVPQTEPPGVGSPTPEPPSAEKPLPEDDTTPVTNISTPKTKPGDAPDLGATQTKKSKARMSYPVRGDIVRAYSKGKNEGIDIAATPGTAVKSAAKGTIAHIGAETSGTSIIVIRHDNNLMTVYSNVESVTVETGDKVSRGDTLAKAGSSGSGAVHFEVRDGFESLDPVPYLTE
ncbi:peptidoglycan DD-metalloendopeptidase family protein [Roseovarius pelagicus]|uniref:Peptidoglycan DD-metalloendopeptidase family protein n=1 Tax=Roseovarius pelagicus TaxID=2980108 RepID=A0ABY6DBS7_9RHOB|nr:peptidoglycan DD-metalloendopeptidase family protein [Roseovarius pelagicus]UXX83545.1 peptidoglycan DD-metalloendopeptidase family protein [Roseovarius pelagicus]